MKITFIERVRNGIAPGTRYNGFYPDFCGIQEMYNFINSIDAEFKTKRVESIGRIDDEKTGFESLKDGKCLIWVVVAKNNRIRKNVYQCFKIRDRLAALFLVFHGRVDLLHKYPSLLDEISEFVQKEKVQAIQMMSPFADRLSSIIE